MIYFTDRVPPIAYATHNVHNGLVQEMTAPSAKPQDTAPRGSNQPDAAQAHALVESLLSQLQSQLAAPVPAPSSAAAVQPASPQGPECTGSQELQSLAASQAAQLASAQQSMQLMMHLLEPQQERAQAAELPSQALLRPAAVSDGQPSAAAQHDMQQALQSILLELQSQRQIPSSAADLPQSLPSLTQVGIHAEFSMCHLHCQNRRLAV